MFMQWVRGLVFGGLVWSTCSACAADATGDTAGKVGTWVRGQKIRLDDSDGPPGCDDEGEGDGDEPLCMAAFAHATVQRYRQVPSRWPWQARMVNQREGNAHDLTIYLSIKVHTWKTSWSSKEPLQDLAYELCQRQRRSDAILRLPTQNNRQRFQQVVACRQSAKWSAQFYPLAEQSANGHPPCDSKGAFMGGYVSQEWAQTHAALQWRPLYHDPHPPSQ